MQIWRVWGAVSMHNGLCFHLMVISLAAVYICGTADRHEDALMIFLIDLHILLTFLGGSLGLTLISMCVIDAVDGKMLTFISLHGSSDCIIYSLQYSIGWNKETIVICVYLIISQQNGSGKKPTVDTTKNLSEVPSQTF